MGQVYVAEPGYVLGRAAVPKFAIITSLAGVATPDLMTFASVLCGLPHGARTPLEYYTFSERHRRKSSILQVRSCCFRIAFLAGSCFSGGTC